MAPWVNTAISVLPAPISTIQTPSSFSSSVSTAVAEANCSTINWSTDKPQRATHLLMFCAALSEPMIRWTRASKRTPDMPTGWRIPSWPSITYSCGRTCNTFWSLGMATARAASRTFSTSSLLTSLSLMATIPSELMLRIWLPAIPTNTD